MTAIPIVKHDDVPGDFKNLGIHRTKEEAIRHYLAWKKVKPNYPYMISVMTNHGDVWYSVWTKTQKNAKKKGLGMKPKSGGMFGTNQITILKNTALNEYRVPGKKGTETSSYYTDDKEDAIATAKAEHGKGIIIKFRTVRS